MTFTVPTVYVLSELVLGADSVIQPTDRLLIGIAQGSTVAVDPSFSSAAALLGEHLGRDLRSLTIELNPAAPKG